MKKETKLPIATLGECPPDTVPCDDCTCGRPQLTEKQLEKMKGMGLDLFGEVFRDTLAYVQIERKLDEIRKKHDQSTTK